MRHSSCYAALAAAVAITSVTALPASAATSPPIFGHGTAAFTVSAAPSDLGTGPSAPIFGAPYNYTDGAGEPSIGTNWNTGSALYMAGAAVYKLTRNSNTGAITWTDTTPLTAPPNLDPILVTDPKSGLTLAGGDNGPCGALSATTDDGTSWLPSLPCSVTVDHPGLGIAPSALTPGSKVAYYCQQEDLENCSTSIDGGLTWLPGTPLNLDCLSLAGHPKGGPDGTTYLPNANCFDPANNNLVGGQKTSDDGASWVGYTIPGATAPASGFDPAVVVTPDNTLYEAWDRAGDYHPVIASSSTHGNTWNPTVDLANTVSPPIVASTFPTLVAGDNGRVAYSFLGTQTGATDVNPFATGFHGKWFLFTSFTYDGGATWTTVKDTATPVQYGEIDAGGTTTAGQRNLLDFMDSAVTKDGRVIVGFADGCLADCEAAASQSAAESLSTHAYATVAYQSTGRGLFAAYDVAVAPSSPTLTATAGTGSVALSWTPPTDDGGAPVTSYQVLRSTGSAAPAVIGTATGSSYADAAVVAGTAYSYSVVALNKAGASEPSAAATATPYAAPAAPVVTLTLSGSNATLTWPSPAANGATITSYQVQRATAAGQETALASVPTNTFTDSGLAAGPTYFYKVVATNAAGPGPASNEVSVKTASAPSAPVLSATVSANQVALAWPQPADGGAAITGYTIKRGTATGTEATYANVGSVLGYTDTAVAAGTRYFYVVQAVNAAGVSVASNEVSVLTLRPPGAPLLTANAGKNQVSLSWTAPQSDSIITGYQILRSSASGAETLIQTISSGTTYVDATTIGTLTYYFKVVALSAVGAGAPSNEASAKPRH